MPANRASRAAYKGQLTSIKRMIEQFERDPANLEHPSARTRLIAQQDLVNRIESRFIEVQREILGSATTDEQTEEEERELMTFQNDCMVVYSKISNLLASIGATSANPSGAQANGESSTLVQLVNLFREQVEEQRLQRQEFVHYMESRNTVGNNSDINESIGHVGNSTFALPSASKLEPIKVPKFYGSYEKWKTFQDLFISIVDKNDHLTNAQKMHYLVTSVEGAAFKEVEHLKVSDANYHVAWERLKKRYDDKVAIVKTLMDKFLEQPTISRQNVNEIRELQTNSSAIINALDSLQVNERDPWLIHCVLKKLDKDSRWLWAQEDKDVTASWQDFDNFLSKICRAMEHSAADPVPEDTSSSSSAQNKKKPAQAAKKASSNAAVVSKAKICPCCQESPHKLFKCKKFLSSNLEDRLKIARDLKICFKCLSEYHFLGDCQYFNCKTCKKPHNSLLHGAFAASDNSSVQSGSSHCISSQNRNSTVTPFPGQSATDSMNLQGDDTSLTTLTCSDSTGGVQAQVLFATAVITVLSFDDKKYPCRIILDPASQVNVISANLCQLLKLPCKVSRFVIDGVNQNTQYCKQEAQVRLEYEINNIKMSQSLDCLVMPKVTKDHPNWQIDTKNIKIPDHLKLADPGWNKCQRVDLLIGGANAWDYFGVERHHLGEGLPHLQSSVFGWLVVGPCFKVPPPQPVSCNITTLASLDKTVRKFWEIEDIPKGNIRSFENDEAEKSFVKNVTRTREGRYEVSLPLNENAQVLKPNRSQAVRQLQQLERRLSKNVILKESYLEVFRDYLKLGFIERVPPNEVFEIGILKYYMPHHCVVRESAASTKIRPVFNASCTTFSGVSLNDCMYQGPVVQPLLISILWRFRMHKYAMTCDIVKMFLQISMHPSHRNLQRFVLRLEDEIEDFRFTTVCFGVAASPFLATRVLMKLADDERNKFPRAARVIRENTYVDDCLTSAKTAGELFELKRELQGIFKMAGMELSKFQSNCVEVLSSEVEENPLAEVPIDSQTKALGIVWKPGQDVFQFKISELELNLSPTKHSILSTIAKIYDPCGFIGPVITRAKLIFQNTWTRELNWHDDIPRDLREEWEKFLEDIPNIEELHIPRWISEFEDVKERELHAFSDASSVAYGAVIYMVSINHSGDRFARMIASKSRVNPVDRKSDGSRKLTIPKAELCGAVLAVELITAVSESLEVSDCYFWTDASVVLYQIHQPKAKQEIFVRNRIRIILSRSQTSQWRYVSTTENPADLISRGSSAKNLINSELWWNGPPWLVLNKVNWPVEFSPSTFAVKSAMVESNVKTIDADVLLVGVPQFRPIYYHLVSRIGTFSKMVRTIAWVLRAVSLFKTQKRVTRSTASLRMAPLSVEELQKSELNIIMWTQREEMPEVISAIESDILDTSNKFKSIRKLRPFIDKDGVLRVGGRLGFADETYDVKHPKILPKGKVAQLIAIREHGLLLHAGPQLTLSSLRLKYWPIRGRDLVRKVSRDCITCRKVRPPPSEQLMGELPACRVSHVRPFAGTGVDLTGHIMLKRLPKGSSLIKAYVVIFVCMSVKAVHLELVTSLSTESFLAALRRFVSRRGIPNDMYSDNGTNFIGAEKEIRDLFHQHSSQEKISDFASGLSIRWHFNAPAAPSHGGLWESAVRSFKHHLRRSVGETLLTYEEILTIITQIEAILNSRPLISLTEESEDPSVLTPGHFLIGLPPIQMPDPSFEHLSINKLNRWQLCQRIQQSFANRWKKEYLTTLQARTKWDKRHKNFKVGDVVLLMENDVSTTHWPVGVVREVHPGVDGLVRVVTVKTTRGEYKRPILKIVKLIPEDVE